MSMKVTTKFTITTKTNHDSLWAEATFADNSYVRFSVTRSGIGSRGNANLTNFQVLASKAKEVYQEWKKNRSSLTYGDLVERVSEAWAKISEDA